MESAALSFSGRKCAGMEVWSRGLHEECGVFGVYDPKGGCAQTTYYGLYALQHRGQEACGIAAINGREQSFYKDVGLVSEVFDKETLDRLNGTMAVGHVRYATTGAGERENAQPLTIKYVKGTLAVVHNGNLVGVDQLRRDFEYKGAIFHTTSDSELIAYAIAQARLHCRSVEDAVCYAARNLKGAFSLLVMSPRKLIACRDPWGFRPLCMGRKGDAILFASESCAIASVGGELERELEPGEIVVVEDGQVRSIRDNCRGLSHMCIFEYIYFARPDSVIAGQSVHQARVNAGKLLAQEHPVEADLVIGVPDSGLDAAQGYAQESGIPYGVGFVKNRYVGKVTLMIEHESNGRDGIESRSWNKVSLASNIFIDPNFMVHGKVWIPIIDGQNNQDILYYSGIYQVGTTFTTPNKRFGFALTMVKRKGWNFKYNTIWEVNYRLFKDENQFLFLQYYNGYGENLLDYNQYHSRLRIGLVIKPQLFSEF